MTPAYIVVGRVVARIGSTLDERISGPAEVAHVVDVAWGRVAAGVWHQDATTPLDRRELLARES